MKSKFRKFWKYAFPVIFSIFLIYWRYGDLISTPETRNDEPNQKHYVKTIKAQKETYSPYLSIYGSFEPSGIVEIPVKYSGTIDKFFIEEGDYVVHNQPLFKMNTSLLLIEYEKQLKSLEMVQAQVRLYKEKVRKSQISIRNKFIEYKKLRNLASKYKLETSKLEDLLKIKKELYTEGAVSGEELKTLHLEYGVKNLLSSNSSLDLEISLLSFGEDFQKNELGVLSQKTIENATIAEQAELSAIESSLKLSEIQLRVLEDALKNSTILSPLEGRILKIRRNAGEYIQSQSAGSIVSLGVINPLNAVFSLGEKDTSLIKKGNIVLLKTDVHGEKEWKGMVKSILPLYEEKSFSSKIKVEIKNSDFLIHPGNFFRGKLYHGIEKERIILPVDVLIGEEFVYSIDNDKALKKKIKSIPLGDGNLEVIEGISEGEEIIVEGKNFLSEGSTITRR